GISALKLMMKRKLKGWKMSENMLHATLVEVVGKGVLIRGKSHSGKSDLALRLIENKNAKLVADDIVLLEKQDNILIGSAPENIAGLLEVYGVGIIKMPYLEKCRIDLIVNTKDNAENIERMPKEKKDVIFGLAIKQIDLYVKENSATEKIMAVLKYEIRA
ncbi:MAG: HPr kinase/phosphatase C-terminal domain-containing protein, partial [Alphaproteobacteria bacterium]|nr:HPr kinase/phosphatase C-terminal domain-containing protein [Alphaproteobacteria bacterium]